MNMDRNKAIIIFNIAKRGVSADLEVPLSISAYDLVIGLNSAYDLGIDTSDVKNCYLKSENPIALLRGNKTLEEFGVRTGTIIYFTE